MDLLEQGTLHTGQEYGEEDDDDDDEATANDLRMQSLQKAWRQVRRTGVQTVERQSGHDSALPMLYSSDWMFSIISVLLFMLSLLFMLLTLSLLELEELEGDDSFNKVIM